MYFFGNAFRDEEMDPRGDPGVYYDPDPLPELTMGDAMEKFAEICVQVGLNIDRSDAEYRKRFNEMLDKILEVQDELGDQLYFKKLVAKAFEYDDITQSAIFDMVRRKTWVGYREAPDRGCQRSRHSLPLTSGQSRIPAGQSQ